MRTGPAVLLPLLTSLACHDGGGGPSALRPDDINASLNSLGVDTTPTPREHAPHQPYPDSYSPLGHRLFFSERIDGNGNPRVTKSRTSELLLAGFALEGSAVMVTVIDHLAIPDDTPVVVPDVLFAADPATTPWAAEVRPRDTHRDGVAADIDGDGVDEMAFVYLDPVSGGVRLRVTRLDDPAVPQDDIALSVPAELFPIRGLRLAAGDFDNDGKDEFAVGVTNVADFPVTPRAFVVVVENAAGGHAPMAELSLPTSSIYPLALVLEAGNLDFDGAEELVVCANVDVAGQQQAATYHVLDDAATGFATLQSGSVDVDMPDPGTGAPRTQTAQFLDVAIGDIDHDQIGEIVFAGCQGQGSCGWDGQAGGQERALLVTHDDMVHGGTRLQSSGFLLRVEDYPADCQAFSPPRRQFVHVDLLDLDGDDDLEILCGRRVFQRFPQSDADWLAASTMPLSVVFPRISDATGSLDRRNIVIAVGDVDGDGRDEVATYRTGNRSIDVYGLDAKDAFGLLATVAVALEPDDNDSFPILVPIDPDAHLEARRVIEFTGEHRQFFTAPVILAALAAPPCKPGIGQATDACRTTWGRFQSRGGEFERQLEFSAGVGFGLHFEAEIAQFEFDFKVTLMEQLTASRSDSYEITRAVNFTTGPEEDSVVFTSIPMDEYVYRIVQDLDDAMIGTRISIQLPRKPVVRIAERGYFNAHVPPGAFQIDDAVFQHHIGDLASYPDRGGKDGLLVRMRSQVDEIRLSEPLPAPLSGGLAELFGLQFAWLPLLEPLQSILGLESDVVGVGQGSGSTEVAIEVNEANNDGRALQQGYEVEVETSLASVKAALSFGGTSSWSTKTTMGRGTSYSGSVGSIDGDHFEDELYNFGMFTYLQADPATRAEFQVVNYWVER